MNISKPNFDWQKLIAVASIYFGLLFFLVAIHILSISTSGDTSSVLTTTFTVLLWIYLAAVVFGLVGVIIQFFYWLAWQAMTPPWIKEQQRQQK